MFSAFRNKLGIGFALICLSTICFGNNVKVGMVKVTDVTSGIATLEIDLTWDNSWRDDYNWDAVYLFMKYKPVSSEWAHVNLQDVQYTATNGCEVMNAKNGSDVVGVYIYPGSKGVYPVVSTKVILKWNCGSGYTKNSFDNCLAFILPQAIEMVYIPYGVYYLGDNYSNASLGELTVDVADNVISEGRYTASSLYNSYLVENAIPGMSGYWCSSGTNKEEWWQVDFGTAKTIRYFGVGTAYGVSYGYLEGSNTATDGDWSILWSGGTNCWPTNSVYPLPLASLNKVEKPKAYRYYRLRMKGSSYSGIYNVVMQEKELLRPAVISSENTISLTQKKDGTTMSIQAAYPKGYEGFYIMKYETSQEQYVTFLNTLKKEEQETLLGTSLLSGLIPGNYIFGDKNRVSARNGIVLKSKSSLKSYLFAHDLNHNGIYNEENDGQCIACNYLSLNDLLAYANWSGLRPMSELEYERACRAPFPQESLPGEYVWNSVAGLASATSYTAAGEEIESVSGNVNVNSGNRLTIAGPLRCGIFARSNSSQVLAGATYWGVMEMGGNVAELVANINNSAFSRAVNGTGNFSGYSWSVVPAQYGIRGGSFATADSLMRISDRTQAGGFYTSLSQRDSTVGFRLVRTLDKGIITMTPGAVSMAAPLCPGKMTPVSETSAATVNGALNLPLTYVWSVKIGYGDYAVIPGETGKELSYNPFVALQGYQFKRKAICALGDAETTSNSLSSYTATSITLQPQPQDALCEISLAITAAGSNLTYQWQQNGMAIEGANTVKYTKKPTAASDAGLYRCLVTGVCGSLYSDEVDMVTTRRLIPGTLVDPRDGQTYKTLIMPDNHEWMVEDLRFGTCDAIIFQSSQNSSVQGKIAADNWGVCINSPQQGCGNLYNWQAIMNHPDAAYGTSGNPAGNVDGNSPTQWRGICPEGWHVPSGGSTGELAQLYNALCKDHEKFYPATDGFAAVLGGVGNGQSVVWPGTNGYYGSSTNYNSTSIYYLNVSQTSAGVGSYVKGYGYAIRCVRDYAEGVN